MRLLLPSKLLALRWILLAAALGCAPMAWADGPPVLRVGTKPNVPPYEYVDAIGELDGFCVEVLRTIAERQGLPMEFLRLSNQEVWDAFDDRRLDIISGAVYTEERTRYMEFSVPLAQLHYVLLVRKGGSEIRSERDLQSQEVLVVNRSHMAAYAAARGFRTKALASYEACLAALVSGEGKAALVPKFTWMHISQRQRLSGLEAVPAEIYPYRVCFAVHKGESALLARLNEGIFELKNSGALDQIYDRHLGSLERSQLPLQTALRKSAVYLLPSFLVAVFLLLLAWTNTLRRLVKRRTADLQDELARRAQAESELERTVEQLRSALAEVKQLSGLLPICAGCKKIRDHGDHWQPLENYISANSEATFSHGLCPDCVKTLYPEFAKGDPAPDQ